MSWRISNKNPFRRKIKQVVKLKFYAEVNELIEWYLVVQLISSKN